MTGQVIALKPQFTNSAAGVTAGQEVFVNQTDGSYASEENTASIGTGDGSTVTFSATLLKVRASTVTVKVAGVTMGTDDGSGALSGAGIASGVVVYGDSVCPGGAGSIAVTFSSAPASSAAVTVEYEANTEEDACAIRELDMGLRVIPVEAKSHPLRLTWSVQAELAAMASIGLDIEDTNTVIAGQFLKIERDRQLIQFISNLAGAVQVGLTFDASAVAGLSRVEVFNDVRITINKAERVIFDASGRGSVNWLIAATDAIVVFKSMKGFVPAANVVPIGAHVVGTVDGITIIKDPYMTAGQFIAGFNGVLPGDSGVIIADWIPVYFTPTQRTADLQGRKGLLSMYDLVSNITTYYCKGSITNI